MLVTSSLLYIPSHPLRREESVGSQTAAGPAAPEQAVVFIPLFLFHHLLLVGSSLNTRLSSRANPSPPLSALLQLLHPTLPHTTVSRAQSILALSPLPLSLQRRYAATTDSNRASTSVCRLLLLIISSDAGSRTPADWSPARTLPDGHYHRLQDRRSAVSHLLNWRRNRRE